MTTSWAPEVCVHGRWSRNLIRLATKDEAQQYADNLGSRWVLVEGTRATEADEPVNYTFNNGELKPLVNA